MKLKKLIKKINEENAPPDGWKPEDKATSSQAPKRVGPPNKVKGFKLEDLGTGPEFNEDKIL